MVNRRQTAENDKSTLLLILHGREAQRDDVRDAVSRLRENGWEIEVRVTWESGDAMRFAVDASLEGFAVVVAGGGDGTVHEVAHGLYVSGRKGRDAGALAILPLGTANDFARSCGIPTDPFEALRLALNQSPKRIDLGIVDDRIFINMLTGGFGTQITSQTADTLKRTLGPGAYVVSALKALGDLDPLELQFEGSGFNWSGQVLFFAVGNSRMAGGGNLLCPDARLDDGRLDLQILPFRLLRDLGGAPLETFLSEDESFLAQHFITHQLSELEIRSPREFQANLDGEPVHGMSFRIRIEKECIAACLPDSAPVLSRKDGRRDEG